MRDEPLRAGNCVACGAALSHALVREVRHYEQTRLLEVTCGRCERTFLAVHVEDHSANALQMEDVLVAAKALRSASSLKDLFGTADFDIADAA
jgi:hypothetical protein